MSRRSKEIEEATLLLRSLAQHSEDAVILLRIAKMRTTSVEKNTLTNLLMENPHLTTVGWSALVNSVESPWDVVGHPNISEDLLIALLLSKGRKLFESHKPSVVKRTMKRILTNPVLTAEGFNDFWYSKHSDVETKIIQSLNSKTSHLTEKHLNDYASEAERDALEGRADQFFRPPATPETAELVLKNPVFKERTRATAYEYLRKTLYPDYPLEWVKALYDAA